MEEWRDVPGYEGLYQISSEGRVKSLGRMVTNRPERAAHYHPEQVRRLYLSRDGYWCVQLRRKASAKGFRVSRLIGMAFLGLTPIGQMNHLNGIKTDNRLVNLEITDASGNARHAYRLGLNKPIRGAANTAARLTELDIRVIRERLARGDSQGQIAADHGVTQTNISAIKCRKSWAHL
jgi:hypothetical protein